MIKIVLIVRSLDYGGTERQVVALARALDKTRFSTTLITFYQGGILAKELDNSGVQLVALNKSGRWDLPQFLIKLVVLLRRLRPEVIYSYQDIPNILALVAKPFCGNPAVIWGSRAADIDLDQYDWLRRLGFSVERKLSAGPDCIIVNSAAGREHLRKHGFPDEKLVVVRNGFDTRLFRASESARQAVRDEWNIAADEVLVGLVARLDPVKDHETFLRAAAIICATEPHIRFVCVGSGPHDYAAKLYRTATELGVASRVLWAGMRSDMASVYNALDVIVSSSLSEGCPNAVGEGMASGVPAVVTDVGDASAIVGETGFVCSPADPKALASAVVACVGSDRGLLGERARRRIEEHWSIKTLQKETERVLITLVDRLKGNTVSLFASHAKPDNVA